MRIKAVIERTVKVDSNVRNARVDLSQMTVSAIAIVTDVIGEGNRPLCGFAFNSFGRYACGGALRDRFIPWLLAMEPSSLLDENGANFAPSRVLSLLLRREKAGGHAERSMALGTLEMALWDIVAKIERRPLYEVLTQRFGQIRRPEERIPTYAAGGFYGAADPVLAVHEEVSRWRDVGFRDVKIKAGGASLSTDCRRFEAALDIVRPIGGRLALDLSCAFDAEAGAAFAESVRPYDMWFLEEPCDPFDIEGYRAVAEMGTPVAGGENLFSAREVDIFLRYGRFENNIVLQPDPPLAYGVTGFGEILAVAETHGLTRSSIFPHGGNMMSLHVAAGLGLEMVEAYPGLFGVFGGFSREVEVRDGFVNLPAAPGIGFEEQPALYDLFRDLVDHA